MDNKIKIIISVSVLVTVICVALLGYDLLSEKYIPDRNVTTSEKKEVQKAPDFTVLDNSGNEVKLSDYFGKPIVVNFWATWCGPCKSELPAFDSAYKKYKDNVEFMMVNLTDGTSETVDGVKAFVSENGYSFPVYYDTQSEAAYTYGISSVPMSVFIDKDGNIVNVRVGAMSEASLENEIKEITE